MPVVCHCLCFMMFPYCFGTFGISLHPVLYLPRPCVMLPAEGDRHIYHLSRTRLWSLRHHAARSSNRFPMVPVVLAIHPGLCKSTHTRLTMPSRRTRQQHLVADDPSNAAKTASLWRWCVQLRRRGHDATSPPYRLADRQRRFRCHPPRHITPRHKTLCSGLQHSAQQAGPPSSWLVCSTRLNTIVADHYHLVWGTYYQDRRIIITQ